jgi:glycosyltransferase involved in cell wall biosynthesis
LSGGGRYSRPVRLSVVIPVYNEPAGAVLAATSAAAAIGESPELRDAELVIADDGSSDGSADAARAAVDGLPVRIARLETNSGRFEARRRGLQAAEGDYVLFLDAGVTVEPGGLRFVGERLEHGEEVWNAHTVLNAAGNPYGLFWGALSALAFADYVRNPRTTSFDSSDFDRFPKGTTCFFGPRELLLEAFESFRSGYADTRHANDDGPVLRFVAQRRRIHISPQFACVYTPRRTLASFMRHAVHRGVVFVDGHGRRESRFFPIVVSFYPLSVAALLLVLRRPLAAPALAAAGAATAVAVTAGRGRPRREVAAFAALAPLYAVAHGLGMWRGLAMLVASRLRPT